MMERHYSMHVLTAESIDPGWPKPNHSLVNKCTDLHSWQVQATAKWFALCLSTCLCWSILCCQLPLIVAGAVVQALIYNSKRIRGFDHLPLNGPSAPRLASLGPSSTPSRLMSEPSPSSPPSCTCMDYRYESWLYDSFPWHQCKACAQPTRLCSLTGNPIVFRLWARFFKDLCLSLSVCCSLLRHVVFLEGYLNFKYSFLCSLC